MKADQRIVLLHLLSLENKWQTEAQLILITIDCYSQISSVYRIPQIVPWGVGRR